LLCLPELSWLLRQIRLLWSLSLRHVLLHCGLLLARLVLTGHAVRLRTLRGSYFPDRFAGHNHLHAAILLAS
jgi:hypothetical protein